MSAIQAELYDALLEAAKETTAASPKSDKLVTTSNLDGKINLVYSCSFTATAPSDNC